MCAHVYKGYYTAMPNGFPAVDSSSRGIPESLPAHEHPALMVLQPFSAVEVVAPMVADVTYSTYHASQLGGTPHKYLRTVA